MIDAFSDSWGWGWMLIGFGIALVGQLFFLFFLDD